MDFRDQKSIAPTIDEVNDNPDELVEMRGEGRYFGTSDPSASIECAHCHQKGHKKAQCKVVVCRSCGVVGDHYERQCPKTMVCNNCGEKGHAKVDCKLKARRIYCQNCGSGGHTMDRCPSIWRSYLTNTMPSRMGLPNNIYCYRCAEKGHYGDECTSSRHARSTAVDGSAFSGHNLPKEVRDIYFSMGKKRKRDDYKPSKSGIVEKVKNTFRKSDDSKNKKRHKQSLSHSQSLPYIPSTGRNDNGKSTRNRAESVLNFPRGGGKHKNNDRDEQRNGFGKYLPSRSGFLGPRKRR